MVLKTSANNAQFTVGSDLTFYKTEINTTHLWLDQSYSTKHYTRYCIYVKSPNDTQFTVNTWFATKDSSARLTVNAPASTNIHLGFYSPNLLTASATGVSSQSWNSTNQTLSMTANTDTSTTITLTVTVTETLETNIPPENYAVAITNMEGCGNWVFAGESTFYVFRARYWDGDGYAELDTCKMAFTDGVTWINASYDTSEEEWSLDSGSSAATIQAGSTSVIDENLLQVTFPIRLSSGVLDCLDVDVYLWCNDTAGVSDGWDCLAEDYFNILHLGGQASLEASTTGVDYGNVAQGKTVWACGEYGAGYEKEKAVDGNYGTRWASDSGVPHDHYIAVDLGQNYTINEVRIKWEVAYANLFNIEYSHDNSSWTVAVSHHMGAEGWQTIYISPAIEAQYWRVVSVLIYQHMSLWELEIYSSTGAGRIVGGDVFELYASGDSGEWAKSTVTFHKLQHIHTLFAIGMPDEAPDATDNVADGSVEFGLDYCHNDAWVTGWSCKITLNGDTDITSNCYVGYTVSWYYQGVFVKSDSLYTFWEGREGYKDYFRVYLDLWFNKINASTTIGGRICSYYHGMQDNAAWWLRWWSSNWGTKATDKVQSMFFTDLTDNSGNIISCKQIDLMRVWARVEGSSTENYTWRLRDFDILSFTVAQDEMEGINTPVFEETRTPDMPATGFVAAFLAGIRKVGETIVNAFTWGAMNIWPAFCGFMDSLGAFFGFPHWFSSLTTTLYLWLTYFWTALGYLATFLVQAFSGFGAGMGTFTTALVAFVSAGVSWMQGLVGFFTGTWTGMTDLWNDFGGTTWLQFACIIYPIYLLFLWESDGLDAVIRQLMFIKDVLAFIGNILLSVARFVIEGVGRIIESIPVVE